MQMALLFLVKPFEKCAAEAVGQLFFEIGAAVHRPLCFLSGHFQKRQVPYDIRRLQVRHAMLVIAEEFTGAPQEEILLRQEEAVLDLAHKLHPRFRHFVMVIGEKDAVGLGFSSSYPAPQLVKLGQAEPVRPV